MKLKEGKIYHLWLRKSDVELEHNVLIRIKGQLKGSPLRVVYDKGYFRIRDKRFNYLFSGGSGFYPDRFVVDESSQLELDF